MRRHRLPVLVALVAGGLSLPVPARAAPTVQAAPAAPAPTWTLAWPAAQATATTSSDVTWLLGNIRPDGAIATNADHALVWPYLANYAASGLARAAAAGDGRAAPAAWGWLDWYQAHQDASGYVVDYQDTGSGLAPTANMDSTDAYAGTFLAAARDALAATGKEARARTLLPGIARAVGAIESTLDSDGLTFAKPTWAVKYLMDNAEVYSGLIAAAEVATQLGATDLAQRAAADAQRVKAGVAALWNPATGAYDWAVHGSGGGHHVTDWTVLYPDVMQQVWAVTYGLVPADRASLLMQRVDATHPEWSQPRARARYDSGLSAVGYWPVGAWALRRVGISPAPFTASIRQAADANGKAWPFTSAIEGELLVADLGPLPSADPPPIGAASTPTTATTTPAPPQAQAATPSAAAATLASTSTSSGSVAVATATSPSSGSSPPAATVASSEPAAPGAMSPAGPSQSTSSPSTGASAGSAAPPTALSGARQTGAEWRAALAASLVHKLANPAAVAVFVWCALSVGLFRRRAALPVGANESR